MKTQLDYVYEHEKNRPDAIWFSQPMGGGQMRDITFREALDQARRMAAYLQAQNFAPGSRIAIFSKNTAWWFIADLAIWMAGHVSVPVYPTLAAGSIRQILEHSETSLIFVGKLDDFDSMKSGLPDALPKVAMPLSPKLDAPAWDDIIRSTQPLSSSPTRNADDLATIIYTSGSTGAPKGVMHSFRTMAAAYVYADLFELTPSDRMISYLPLAHVAERGLLQTINFKIGFRVFFAESLDTFIEDVKRCRPTVFGSVPRLWQKFQAGVHAKVPPQKLSRLLSIPILKNIIRKKIVSGLGLDQARATVTGSAPTPPEVMAWYKRLGLEHLDVYAMTENFAVSHAARPGKVRPGYVGSPLPGVEQKIGENGEILVKSPGTTLGYYKAEELTRELIDSEGWIHTGDRGELDQEGRLKVTGRVKELFKTSKGKYVAPAPIESAILACPELEQVCVTGVGLAQPIALVVLSEAHRTRGVNEAVKATLMETLSNHLRTVNAQLDPHEQVDRLVVIADEWTTANGLLTPTLKLKRNAIDERYGHGVPKWATEQAAIVWVETGTTKRA